MKSGGLGAAPVCADNQFKAPPLMCSAANHERFIYLIFT